MRSTSPNSGVSITRKFILTFMFFMGFLAGFYFFWIINYERLLPSQQQKPIENNNNQNKNNNNNNNNDNKNNDNEDEFNWKTASEKSNERIELPAGLKPSFHFVFNVDCFNYKQNWQSFLLINSFLQFYDEYSGATMTELVSCPNISYRSPWEGKLPPHVKTLTVLDFQSKSPELWNGQGMPYWPYNKPIALQAWLDSKSAPPDTDMAVVIDPDFIMLRPLSREFTKITEKQVVANYYAISGWQNYRIIANICSHTPHCKKLSEQEKMSHSVGVPNILHISTLRQIVPGWLEYTIKLHTGADTGSSWSDEQYGYIFSVVMKNFQHLTRTDLMVTHGNPEWGDGEWITGTPHYFIHYCQQYKIGEEWSWTKHDFHKDKVFTCDKPPLELAPNKVGLSRQGWFSVVITQNFRSAWNYWKKLMC